MSGDEAKACIIGIGASTPVGRNVWASAAAVRAGVSGFSEHPYLIHTGGEPMRVARAPWLDVMLQGVERYEQLLFPAIDQALSCVRNQDALRENRMGIVVALPPRRPGCPSDLGERMAASVAARYRPAAPRILTFEIGHAAGYVALDAVLRSLSVSSTDACIIAGVDSYLSPETLEWVEASDQLHSAGPMNNAWGFIPGEGAAALLVTSTRSAHRLETDSLGEIVGIGLGQEANLIKTDSVCIGEGLTSAFKAALAGLSAGEVVHNVFCDLNGEPYRADEYGLTCLRTKQRFRAAADFVAPADVWGDVGAAGAPLHVCLSLICHRKRYGYGPLSLTCASSESGERGAAVIRASDGEGH